MIVAPSKQWAAKELEIPAQSETDAARTALLEHLQTEDFLPAENRIAAWNCWAKQPIPVTVEGRNESADARQKEFDSFLAIYWKLGRQPREARWRDLRVRNQDGRIATRLIHLEKGLTLPSATAHSDPKVLELAAVFRELYLLPPRSRTVRRHDWLESLGNREEWLDVLRDLREVDARVAELDPLLLPWIEEHCRTSAMVIGRSAHETPPAWGDDLQQRSFVPEPPPPRRTPVPRYTETESSSANGKKAGIGIGVVILVVIFILRAVVSVSNSKPDPIKYTPTPQPAFKYTPPPPIKYTPPPAFPDAEAWKNRLNDPQFSHQELLAFATYDPSSGQPQPPRYATFMFTGGKEVLENKKKDPDFQKAMEQYLQTKKNLEELKRIQPKYPPVTRR